MRIKGTKVQTCVLPKKPAFRRICVKVYPHVDGGLSSRSLPLRSLSPRRRGAGGGGRTHFYALYPHEGKFYLLKKL